MLWSVQLDARSVGAATPLGPMGRFWAGCISSDVQELSARAAALACPGRSQFTARFVFSAFKAEVIACIRSYFPMLSESTCIGEGHGMKRWDEKRLCSL